MPAGLINPETPSMKTLFYSDVFITGLFCSILIVLKEVCAQSLSGVQPLATPWTVALQVPLFMEFSRQEFWSGLLPKIHLDGKEGESDLHEEIRVIIPEEV